MTPYFSAGAVIGESFKVVFRCFLTIVGISFLCCLPFILVMERTTEMEKVRREAILKGVDAPPSEPDLATTFGSLLIYVTYPLASGAIAIAVHRSFRGESVSFAAAFGAGLKRIFALFGVFVSSLLFMGVGFVPAILFLRFSVGALPWPLVLVGFLLLSILALALFMMVYVSIPVCIVERKGVFASMRRSRELTAGHRWNLFVVMIGVFLSSYVIGIVAGIVAGVGLIAASPSSGKAQGSLALVLLLSTAFGALFIAWNAAAPAVAYCHLARVKDTQADDDVLKAFD